MEGELERHLWSNYYLGLCVYSALCTWKRLAFYELVQEGLISSGQQYPVRHQVKTQGLSLLAWILESHEMTCFCKTRNVSGSLFILTSFSYMCDFLAYMIMQEYFDFPLNVLQQLKTDNIRVCVYVCKVIF